MFVKKVQSVECNVQILAFLVAKPAPPYNTKKLSRTPVFPKLVYFTFLPINLCFITLGTTGYLLQVPLGPDFQKH